MCDACSDDGTFKSAPGTPERMKELDQRERDTILQYGHQVRAVFPAPDDVDRLTFWYSVGRCVFDKPEFLVAGPLPMKVGHYMVNEIARMADAGEIEVADGVTVKEDTLLAGFPCRLVRCDPHTSEMTGAVRLGGKDVEAYQVIWPDKDGVFPDEPGYDTRFHQPIFRLETSV